MDGVLHGFKLVDPSVDVGRYHCENYFSATNTSKGQMDKLIRPEIQQGKLSVVSSSPDCIHAMGAKSETIRENQQHHGL